MNYAEFTRELPTLRMKRATTCKEALAAPAAAREFLRLGCVLCRSPFHGQLACPQRDDDKDVTP